MPETLGSWGAIIKGTGAPFLEFFSQNDLSEISGWDPIIRTIRSGDQTVNFSGKTGSGLLTRFSDGSAIPSANRYKLYDTAAVLEPYGARLEVTRQTLLFRSNAGTFSESNDLMKSYKSTLSRAGAQIFNRGFTDGSGVTAGVRVVQYGDAAPTFSASHPRADGGTAQSNSSATGIPLTESNMNTGMIALQLQLQDDGVPMAASGMGQVWLVTGINLDKTASIITGSNLRSGTANNDVNVYGGGKVKVMTSPWLDSGISASSVGSNTQWFLIAQNWVKFAIVVSNEAPKLDFLTDKDTKSGIFDVYTDLGVCSYDWRGGYGSLGDNATYSG